MLYRSNCRALNVIVAKRILIVFLFVSLGGFDRRTAALNDEGRVLLEFAHNLNDTLGTFANWNASHSTPCAWTGIVCSPRLHVLYINLSGKELRGTITLRKLSWLQVLNLSSNHFGGEIPASLANCSTLQVLTYGCPERSERNLHSNNLTGEIPAALASLENLKYLNLENNRLQGEIPASLVDAGLTRGLSFLYGNNVDLMFTRQRPRSVRILAVDQVANSTPEEAAGRGTSTTFSTATGRSNRKSGNLSIGAILSICICVFVLSKIFLGTLCYRKWVKQHSTCEIKLSGGKMVMFQQSGKATPSSKAVLRQTEKLKQSDVIGSGGFGIVYKLVLDDMTAFAVKKLTRVGGPECERGFERELATLADIKHRNLITLRGYYTTADINLLLYDLMSNGNLDSLLHGAYYAHKGSNPLDWDVRLKIAIGSARGLSYLHHDCIPHVIHRDIKSSNILLDDEMEAHVSDFGLAKLINPQDTHVTTIVAGTLGYLPPEYMETGKVTEKGDVYSFGIVLLELLTGMRPTNEVFKTNDFNMVQWAKNLVQNGHPEDIFDGWILGSCPDEELMTALDIAFQCVDAVASSRPSMLQVVKMLERIHGDIVLSSVENLSSHLTSSQLPFSATSSSGSSTTNSFQVPNP
ncbi:unnamed protein product [Sphagnum compactum]